ncbi:hypothetical protein EG68_04975 [Paragonimus skrjabini miyazakii]|uniref:Uncharacterized protein n=1 Tax=Paragonimus skrjabini miyazakii TaxID=59628 RepID=A0A8S9Z1D2_9TREM|nr:hypothetical protein EG68_04975 [Paragonimus skrjabini miyazakii]
MAAICGTIGRAYVGHRLRYSASSTNDTTFNHSPSQVHHTQSIQAAASLVVSVVLKPSFATRAPEDVKVTYCSEHSESWEQIEACRTISILLNRISPTQQ